jgi:two-component system, NarL family, sensor histidine kinase DesK
MADGGGRTALTPWLAKAFPTAFLCMVLPARAGVAVDVGNGAAGSS